MWYEQQRYRLEVVHTHQTSCRSGWPRRFGELNPSPHSSIFTSVSVDSSPRSYLFTSMVRIRVQTAPKCCTEPLRYMTLHFRDPRGAASPRYRKRAKITVLMCEQKPKRVFSLTWPASMQIYRNKRKRLHKKRVQLPQDWFGTPTWPPFHCFGTPIWPR